ncbi:hypothetical protein AAHE18_04G244100 [Arachis hypogaea]
MLCVLRNRNGGACFSITCHLFNNLSATVSVHSSPPQSILSTNSIVPTRKTPPTTSSSSSSLAVSICSLLCHRVSSNSDNIDNVLGPYKGVLNSKIVLRVLMSYKQLGRAKTLNFFSWAGTHMGFQLDHFVVEYMLDFLCRRKLFDDMKCLLMTVSLHNQVGRLEAALEIFGRMDEIGVIPSRSAVNILIGELCSMSAKEGSVEKLRVKNTRRPYTILVPNVGCSSNTNSGSIQPAIAVFRAVHRSGLWPSSFVVVKFISELCRLGKTEEAVEILMIAEEKKLTCVGEGYSIVIRALCEQRRVEEASKLFGRMLQHGLKPKLVVYNSIISMLCKLGNLNDATRVYEIMNKKRCLPDNSTYAALIHANGERKNWKVAYDLLTEMLGFGWIPHFHTYNLVDSLLREHDQLDLCCKLERKLENKKLQKLCKIGQLDAAYEKAKSMLEQGICLSPSARDTFKDVFQKCGKLNVVRQLLETIEPD